MPEIAGGNEGRQTDVLSPQSPSPVPFSPSLSDGVLSGSLSTATSRSDAMSESSYNYSYNRADFPYDNEWEEFRSLSFKSAPSSSASFAWRQDSSRRQLLREVREKYNHLLVLLRQLKELPWSAIHPDDRPRGRIKQDTDNVLTKASALVTYNIFRRAFNIPTSSIAEVLLELENAIGNVSWLIRVAGFSSGAGDKGYLGLPPIANDEPVLYFMWEQVVKLLNGFPEDQAAAAAELGSLDQKLFIEEGGIQPLLNVIEVEKDVEMQEKAAKALGLLSREGPRVVDVMVQAGICTVFTKVLNVGPMKVQAMVAWAISELATHHPQCQDDFAKNNTVQLLVGHLAFETFQGQRMSSAAPVPKAASVVLVNAHIGGREQEDPVTEPRMKAMAAKALSALAKGNPGICKSVTETQALLTFAVLLEKGTEEVRSKSAIAVMEIARVAEADNQIRRLAFRPSSPAADAVVNQLLQIVRKDENNDLLVPSIIALGCLSKTFRFWATKTRLIGALIRLLDERETDVMLETVIALTKFAKTYTEYCKAIIDEGGVKHLIELVYFEELVVQKSALILLCYVARHVRDNEELAQVEVLMVLEWASKQSGLVQDPTIDRLLPEAKSKLELYQAAAATELGSLDGYRNLIIEEGGIQLLLNVLNVGKDVEVQERAAKALGLLSREGPRGVDVMDKEGICTVFTKVLNEGAMKVQAMVAWAIFELATHHPEFQDDFAENNTVQLLVGHLAFETFQEERMSSAIPVPEEASIHSVVLANANAHIRGKEQEDPATKSYMKAMAAKALSALAKGNPIICKSITETQALLILAELLEKGTEEVRYNSVIAVMEISRVAEVDNQIMRLAFPTSSPIAKVVVNQLLQIIRKAEYNDLLVPSIIALGCLSNTFMAVKACPIGPLVRLLDKREADVMQETAIALTKFAEIDNYFCKEHCEAIIDEGGLKHLIELVYFGELVVQKPSLILLYCITKYVPDNEELAQAEVLTVLEWASKQSDLVEA